MFISNRNSLAFIYSLKSSGVISTRSFFYPFHLLFFRLNKKPICMLCSPLITKVGLKTTQNFTRYFRSTPNTSTALQQSKVFYQSTFGHGVKCLQSAEKIGTNCSTLLCTLFLPNGASDVIFNLAGMLIAGCKFEGETQVKLLETGYAVDSFQKVQAILGMELRENGGENRSTRKFVTKQDFCP